MYAYSANTTYLSPVFNTILQNKNTIDVLSKYNIIGSKNALFISETNADISDVMIQAWFLHVAAFISYVSDQKLAFPSHFEAENGNVVPVVYTSLREPN